MKALREYIAALVYQADRLDWAQARDGLAESALSGHFRRGARRQNRIWTRQDKNWLALQYRVCELEAARGQDKSQFDHETSLKVMEAYAQAGRIDRRVYRVLHALRTLPRHSIERFHAAALTEAAKLGTYAIIVEPLKRATRAHEALLTAWGEGHSDDWNAMLAEHAEAIAELKLLCGSETTENQAEAPAAAIEAAGGNEQAAVSRNTLAKFRVIYADPLPTKPMQRFAALLAADMNREKIEIGREIAGENENRAKSLVTQFNTLLTKNRVRFEPIE